jgi:uncharacterized protein
VTAKRQPAGDGTAPFEVEVAWAEAERQWVVPIRLPAGSTVADALAAVAATPPFDRLELDTLPVGIYGERVARDRVLQPFDRVELYRPLQMAPREARRRRAGPRRTTGTDTKR